MGETMEFPATWQEFIKAYSFFDEKKEYTNGAELITVLRVRQMMEHYAAPTIDAEPVRHGVWLDKPIAGYSTVRCSRCSQVFPHNSGKWYYCPWCGAKMDGGGACGTA